MRTLCVSCNNDRILTERAISGLSQIRGVQLLGPPNSIERCSIVSFNVKDISPTEVGWILNDDFNICVRSGKHCAINYFKEFERLGHVPGTVRASFYVYNTVDEVDRFLDAVEIIAVRST
ncbi:MAG: aminotransferase class V-fold PLP-dependent enzyme [Bacilli bacterium]